MFSGKYPPAPHPRFKPKKLETPPLTEDPLVNDLKDELNSIKKDIDLNTGRLEYKQSVKVTLSIISDLLEYAVELINAEQAKEKNEKPKKKVDTGYGKF